MNQITLKIEVEVNLTEDLEKVKTAVQNLFSYPSIESTSRKQGDLLIIKAEGKDGLNKFFALLRQERILNAARKVFFGGLGGNLIIFYLNKQAAYVKHISFCSPVGESPLGPIKVEIICDNPKELIDWLAPRVS